MEEIFERLRSRLEEKKDRLNHWVETSPVEEKAIRLGSVNENAVCEHIHALETSIASLDDGRLGICDICGQAIETELLEVDYTATVCLEHLTGEEADQLQNELELAQSVQKSLLPQQVPQILGLDSAAFSRPAQYVGGDYFDFIAFENGSAGLLIADVAGHGVSASLQMAGLQALARAIIPISRSPAEAVRHVHQLFIHNILFTTFVTLFLAEYDPRDRTLRYCNAGHNPALLLRQGPGGILAPQWLRPTGPAIGLVEDSIFVEEQAVLQSGDLLVMYTDGVVEAGDPAGQLFGVDRLVQAAQALHDLPARALVRGIRETLEQYAGGRPFADDTTFVVCKVQ